MRCYTAVIDIFGGHFMRAARILGMIAAVIAIAVTGVYSAVWTGGERILRRQYETPVYSVTHSTDADVIAVGSRLADIAGCTGCHGAELNGKIMGEEKFVFRSVAPNLARLSKTYSDADFARSIRHGVRADGTGVWGMPSPAFFELRDEDLEAILSFIRAQTDKREKLPKDRHWILDRLYLLQNENPMEAAAIDHFAQRRTFDFSAPLQQGEYLARLACAECHGVAFDGGRAFGPETPPPDLIVASAYSRDEFAKLMREGASFNGRDLGLMGAVARSRFGIFTDREIDALHAFLTDRALTLQAE